MKFRTTLVCAVAAAFLLPALTYAEHTRYWRQSDSGEFEKGTAKGVAIRSDGKLMPAPQFTALADPNLAYIWQLRLDSHGRLYAAGGPNAKVLRLDDAGKATTVFDSSELAAQAITFDAKDNLYVGTSPDGKVYKVTPDGQKSVFFDPKTKYIWALAMDSQGTLFVGTGDKGEVYVVAADGKGEVFYQSDERHARSLALDSKGNLLIGTEPNGLILRVPVERKNAQVIPAAGSSFVVYETNKKEVTSLLQDADGNLYAASIGEKSRNLLAANPQMSPQAPTAVITAQGGGNITISQGTAQGGPPVAPLTYFASATGGAEVVKISPDGSPQTLWTSREDLVFSAGLSPAGKLLLGTGNKGAVIELEGNDVYSSIAKSASAQVTSLVAGAGGKMFVATANPGKIFALGPGYEKDGSFESDTFDAKIFSHWGRLTWWGENGATRGKVAFYVRSGNTSSPEKNWGPWAGPYKDPDADAVSCPPARFAQWKAVFLDTDGGGEPSISWVSLAYQPKNVAPVVEDIVVQDPGVRIQGFAAQPAGPVGAANVQLRMPQREGAFVPNMNPDVSIKASRMDVPPQGFEERGYESVLWSARDDNDDDLVFTIYYRGEGEKNWRLLKDKITPHYYSWDTTTMPDGAYYLKIVASDSPSNPPDQAQTDERESDRFEVANTPPRIEALRAQAHSPTATVTFEGVSTGGALARAQYSLDGGDWQVVFPVGLLSDSPKQKYEIQLSGLAPGEHTIAVEISDRFENKTSAKVTFITSSGTK